MVGSLSFPSRRLAGARPAAKPRLSALTGASIEPKAGSCVMVRAGPTLTRRWPHIHDVIQMDDLIERDLVPEPISLARCRQLLADEARELSDEDIDALRRHAHAMAHTLIDVFLHEQCNRRG